VVACMHIAEPPAMAPRPTGALCLQQRIADGRQAVASWTQLASGCLPGLLSVAVGNRRLRQPATTARPSTRAPGAPYAATPHAAL
jgi:hypothetical protein